VQPGDGHLNRICIPNFPHRLARDFTLFHKGQRRFPIVHRRLDILDAPTVAPREVLAPERLLQHRALDVVGGRNGHPGFQQPLFQLFDGLRFRLRRLLRPPFRNRAPHGVVIPFLRRPAAFNPPDIVQISRRSRRIPLPARHLRLVHSRQRVNIGEPLRESDGARLLKQIPGGGPLLRIHLHPAQVGENERQRPPAYPAVFTDPLRLPEDGAGPVRIPLLHLENRCSA
jgi:hypothetical protein